MCHKRIQILVAGIALVLFLTPRPSSSKDAVDAIEVLDGYSIKKESAVDAITWTIQKSGGLSIHFEAGFSEGLWADPKDSQSYSWMRIQRVNGYKVIFALVRPGLKTRWEPKNDLRLPPGNILLVTFILDDEHSFHTANFSAKIGSDQDLADVLLMVMTFNPSKGKF
jgi:hypothetical protein